MDIGGKLRGAGRLTGDLLTNPHARRSWGLRLSRPDNLFQPFNDTLPNRYPMVFSFLQRELGDRHGARLLSFGCSVGDEVFSLRQYLPDAWLVGVDISRGNIRACHRRSRQTGDARMTFVQAATSECYPNGQFDAVLCMAVFRHGDLGSNPTKSCAHRITFSSFEDTVGGLARRLKTGGYLAIDHSNFRFSDTAASDDFSCVAWNDWSDGAHRTPLFGPDNLRLGDQDYRQVIFKKER